VELRQLRRVQVPRGDGHRRGVFGDLLGHRRADPGAGAWPARPLRQQHLLGRGDTGEPAYSRAAEPERGRPVLRLEDRVRPRRGAGLGHTPGPPVRPGEPAMAHDPRQGRRGGPGDRSDRRRSAAVHGARGATAD
jgi:hypothetical protein